jgi:predicted site-specific integrase-resolvase
MNAAPPLLNSKALAAALGVSAPVVTRWKKAGVISPEISEARCLRWDLQKVRATLAARATTPGKR